MKKVKHKRLFNGQILTVRKTQRNQPCPYGRKKIIVDQKGQEFEKPMKFKHCCLTHES